MLIPSTLHSPRPRWNGPGRRPGATRAGRPPCCHGRGACPSGTPRRVVHAIRRAPATSRWTRLRPRRHDRQAGSAERSPHPPWSLIANLNLCLHPPRSVTGPSPGVTWSGIFSGSAKGAGASRLECYRGTTSMLVGLRLRCGNGNVGGARGRLRTRWAGPLRPFPVERTVTTAPRRGTGTEMVPLAAGRCAELEGESARRLALGPADADGAVRRRHVPSTHDSDPGAGPPSTSGTPARSAPPRGRRRRGRRWPRSTTRAPGSWRCRTRGSPWCPRAPSRPRCRRARGVHVAPQLQHQGGGGAVSPEAKAHATSSEVTKGLTASRKPALAVKDSGPYGVDGRAFDSAPRMAASSVLGATPKRTASALPSWATASGWRSDRT